MLTDAGRQDIIVESAGTGAYEGAPASEGAYLVALEQGLDLSDHRARLLDRDLVAGADLILAVSPGHLSRVERLGGEGKAYLLGDYANAPANESDLRDPYGGDVEGYRQTLQQLERLLRPTRERLLAESTR
jgi:protein-tyrosine-phosphatase